LDSRLVQEVLFLNSQRNINMKTLETYTLIIHAVVYTKTIIKQRKYVADLQGFKRVNFRSKAEYSLNL